MTNVTLAREIRISPPSTLERVKKLENSGIIKKYAAIIDPEDIISDLSRALDAVK